MFLTIISILVMDERTKYYQENNVVVEVLILSRYIGILVEHRRGIYLREAFITHNSTSESAKYIWGEY